MGLVRSVIGSVHALKKPGGGKNKHSVFKKFSFYANVYFEAKSRTLVGEEGDPSFDVGPGLKKQMCRHLHGACKLDRG